MMRDEDSLYKATMVETTDRKMRRGRLNDIKDVTGLRNNAADSGRSSSVVSLGVEKREGGGTKIQNDIK